MQRRNHQALRFGWVDEIKRLAASGDQAGVSDLVEYIRDHVDQIGVFDMMWTGIISSSAKRGIMFSISKAYALRLFREQGGVCAISGLPISFRASDVRPGRKSSGDASLDRINSDLGYTEGNVWWVHKDINMMKGAHSLARFIELCRRVAGHDDAGAVALPSAGDGPAGEARAILPAAPVQHVAWFLRHACEDDPLHTETAADLWRSYQGWCSEGGSVPRSRTAFGRALRELGYSSERGHIVRWHGLRLKAREGARVGETRAQPAQRKLDS